MSKMANKKFTITKKIAKHGSHAIICIPSILQSQLKPGLLVQVKIEIIKDVKDENKELSAKELPSLIFPRISC